MANERAIDETAPLLQNDRAERQHTRWWTTVPFTIDKISPAVLVPLIGSLTIFLNECEFYIKQPAMVRLLEAMACHEYYAKQHDPLARLGKAIPELMCKNPPIQDRVATLFGMVYIVRTTCSVIGTFVILTLFKTGRRRPILVAHKANIVVSNLLLILAYYGYPKIPIWFVCVNSASALFGGNYDLSSSIMFAAYADVIPDKTRRSNLIFMSASMQYIAQVVCLPLTSYLINLNGTGNTPQVSVFVSTGCAVVILLVMTFFMPETFRPEMTQPPGNQNETTTPEPDASSHDTRPSQSQPIDGSNKNDPKSDRAHPQQSHKTDNIFRIVRNDFGLVQVMFLLLAMSLSSTATHLIEWYGLLQYPSLKYHWTVSKTTYLICMQGVLGAITFTLVLPSINKLCHRKFGVSAESASVGIATGSALILMVCSLVFGLPGTSSTVFVVATAISAFGCGVYSAIQTYIVTAAPTPRSSGAALSVISLAATAGKFASSAIWPAALHLGLSYPSGKLAGLPFFVTSVLLICVVISMSLAKCTARSVTR